jgi:hypothetical protein
MILERASILRYTYIACLVIFLNFKLNLYRFCKMLISIFHENIKKDFTKMFRRQREKS